jgi:hypothetical protein
MGNGGCGQGLDRKGVNGRRSERELGNSLISLNILIFRCNFHPNVVCCQMSRGVMMRPETLETQLLKRIARKQGDVFLRADFTDLGGYDQVGRALLNLVRKGQLMKVGYGLYARTRPSLLDGKPLPAKGIRELATEALGRIGIEATATRLEEAYNAGKTTQVPTGRVIGVRGRVRRKLSYNGFPLSFERARPAPR